MANPINSDQSYSGVAQTASLGTSTSVTSGAAKIFREFKWGLLTLVLLMAVVLCLIPPKNKPKTEVAENKAASAETEKFLSGTVDTGMTGMPEPFNGPGGSAGTDRTASAPNRPEERTPDRWTLAPETSTPTPPTQGLGNNGGSNTIAGANQNTPHPGTRRNGFANLPPEQPRTDEPVRPRPGLRQPESRTPVADGGFKTYVVKPGDNLTKIASANLPGKGGMKAILDANKDVLPDANRLREGMKLKIPNAVAGGTETTRGTHSESAQTSTSNQRRADGPHEEYVVQSGDTLERIARRVLNDASKWKDLMEWNKDRISDASKLKVGMVLRIHASGQTSPVNHPAEMWRRNNTGNGTIRAGVEQDPALHEPEEPAGEEATIPYFPISRKDNPVSANTKAEIPSKERTEDPIP